MKKILAVLLAVALVATLSLSAVITASATGDPTIVVSSATVKAGETVDITITFANNPGITTAKLKIAHTDDVTVNSVTFNKAVLGGTTGTSKSLETNPLLLNWSNGGEDIDGDTLFATINFTVSSEATEGDKALTVTYNSADFSTIEEEEVAFAISDGVITVVSCLHDGTKTEHPAVASTCKTAGHAAYTTCDLCSAVVSGSATPLDLDSSNHEGETELRDAAPATCTATGYTGDTYCLGCGEKIATGTTIAVTSHNLGEWLKNSESHWKVCASCEGTFEFANHDYNAVVTNPTCTEGGFTTYTCKVCGYSYTGNETDALGHTGGTANCHSGAICTRCHLPYGDKDAANHDGGTEIKNAKEATVDAEGYTGDKVCKGCGATLEEGKVIPKLVKYEPETADEKFDATSSKPVSVKVKFAEGKNVVGVKINGTVISEDKYDVIVDEEGNTTIALKEDYLKTLGNGTYTETVVTEDGFAETTFEVVNSTVNTATTTTDGNKSSKTGDVDIALIVIALLGVMAASMFAGVTYSRKRED